MNQKQNKKRKIILSIIIISFNTKDLIKKCIASVEKYTKELKYEFVIVDNNSNDGSVDFLRQLQRSTGFKIIFNDENIGFGPANNMAMDKSQGEFLLFLNSDTVFTEDLLKDMVQYMDENKSVGCVSCMLRNSDGTIQGTGGYFPNLIRVFSWMTIQDFPFVDEFIKPFHPMKARSLFRANGFYEKEKELDWVTGAFMLMRKKAVEDTGYFDKDYFMYTEEVDYFYRMKGNGWKVLYLPQWSIIHLGGRSGLPGSGILQEFNGVKTFYKKHYPGWQYPVLRILLKLGTFWRMIVFGLLRGKEDFAIYAKAFQQV